jgi:putative two-component system response regulator
MEQHEAELAAVERDIQANLSAPVADTPAFLEDCLRRLRQISFSVQPARRVALLIDITWQFHHHGQRPFSGVEPIALAVMLARQHELHALLRRALSIQGLVLTSTNNTTDALRSLMEALDLGESLGDPLAVSAAWINMANTFFEATLFNDARICHERGVSIVYSQPDSAMTRSFAARGLHGSSLCSLFLHEYLKGIETSEEAVDLLREPQDREEEAARADAESTYAQLLLATNQVDKAAERAEIAHQMAERSKSVRAMIAASTAQGLVEVFSGSLDVGLSRMVKIRDQARILPSTLREALQASVVAYERANRPDRAISMHRELMMHVRKAHKEAILQNQTLHLKRLELPETATEDLTALEQREGSLQDKLAELAGAQTEFLEQMALTVELREEDSGFHPYRVGAWSAMLAIEAGLTESEARQIELAARLHDIGKVVVPDSVIRKATALSAGERSIIETHAVTGAEFLSRATLPYARLAEEIARYHHERWSGDGYPEGLSGKAIPLPARIVGLCDTFDALVHDRPFRHGFTLEAALGHIARESERHFDPELVALFIPLVRRVHAEHADLDAFLTRVAEHSPLLAMRRTLGEKLASGLPATSNDQSRQQQQGRLLQRRSPTKPA